MVCTRERNLIYDYAYVPEHLPDYVEAISGAEAFFHEGHVCYVKGRHLIFIGYPLSGEDSIVTRIDIAASDEWSTPPSPFPPPHGEGVSKPSPLAGEGRVGGKPVRSDNADFNAVHSTAKAYESACKRFDPITIAIVAPRIWFAGAVEKGEKGDIPLFPSGKARKKRTGKRGMSPFSQDMYYRLDLPCGPLRSDLAYMVRRASRELEVSEGSFGEEHIRMVDAFVAARDLLSGHQEIFRAIPSYLKRSRTAILLEARRRGELIAFNVLDLGSRDWGFWLFHFRSAVANVPGASDLLFHEMVRVAEAKGKKRFNLGLGINAGIRRFKEKWGSVAFLPYVTTSMRRKRMDVLRILTRF
jgi:hypothetical protein